MAFAPGHIGRVARPPSRTFNFTAADRRQSIRQPRQRCGISRSGFLRPRIRSTDLPEKSTLPFGGGVGLCLFCRLPIAMQRRDLIRYPKSEMVNKRAAVHLWRIFHGHVHIAIEIKSPATTTPMRFPIWFTSETQNLENFL